MNVPTNPAPVELKPCPFCGSDAQFVLDNSYGACGVGCSAHCDPEPYCEARIDQPEKAITAWNTRIASLDGWRPIEEAPKDGWFLGYWPVKTLEDRIQVTRWYDDDAVFINAADSMDWAEPTHFRPLPPPPETGEEA